MRNHKIKNVDAITLEWEDVSNGDIINITYKNEISYKYNTTAKELVQSLYSKVRYTEHYKELFNNNRAKTELAKKLLLTQLIMAQLMSIPVKYHTKKANPVKREFRLAMTMVAKLAEYAKQLTVEREDKWTRAPRPKGFINTIKQLWQ